MVHIVDVLLVPTILVSFGSGVWMWVSDIGGSDIHKWSSVALFVLAVWHFKFQWKPFSHHGRTLFSNTLRAFTPPPRPKPAPSEPVLAAAAPQAEPPLDQGWELFVTAGWTQTELDDFVHIRAHCDEYGIAIGEITLDHVRGINRSVRMTQ